MKHSKLKRNQLSIANLEDEKQAISEKIGNYTPEQIEKVKDWMRSMAELENECRKWILEHNATDADGRARKVLP